MSTNEISQSPAVKVTTAEMETQTVVFIRTTFEAVHRWASAPEKSKLTRLDTSFLCFPHRHKFHVVVGVNVTAADRQVEFLDLKQAVDWLISDFTSDQLTGGAWEMHSCEMMASDLMHGLIRHRDLDVRFVEVSEDGENGAFVMARPIVI